MSSTAAFDTHTPNACELDTCARYKYLPIAAPVQRVQEAKIKKGIKGGVEVYFLKIKIQCKQEVHNVVQDLFIVANNRDCTLNFRTSSTKNKLSFSTPKL